MGFKKVLEKDIIVNSVESYKQKLINAERMNSTQQSIKKEQKLIMPSYIVVL